MRMCIHCLLCSKSARKLRNDDRFFNLFAAEVSSKEVTLFKSKYQLNNIVQHEYL